MSCFSAFSPERRCRLDRLQNGVDVAAVDYAHATHHAPTATTAATTASAAQWNATNGAGCRRAGEYAGRRLPIVHDSSVGALVGLQPADVPVGNTVFGFMYWLSC